MGHVEPYSTLLLIYGKKEFGDTLLLGITTVETGLFHNVFLKGIIRLHLMML